MMTTIEAVAALCGLLAVWFTVRENILCWPAGLVQVSLYVFVFLDAKLYSDMILHCIYVVLQLIGWYHWLHGGKGSTAVPVNSIGSRTVWWIGATAAGTAAWGYVMHTYTDAAAPYPDAFIAVASLIAQWLTTRKSIESWYFWIAVNILGIGVYWYKHLLLTAGLYFVFLILCILGVRKWRLSEVRYQKLHTSG